MKKNLKILAVLAVVVFTLEFGFLEVSSIGTITGRTLLPLLIGLLWYMVSTIVKDFKEFFLAQKVEEVEED